MSDLKSLAADFGVSPVDRMLWRKKAKQIVIEQVEVYGVTPADIMGYRKPQNIAYARQSVMWRLSRELPGIMTKEIGSLLNRERTTVIYGIQAHIERMGEQK